MHFSLFPKSVYENRRNRLQQIVGSGLIILLGNEESGMNYKDNTYPFRQDSSFLYYFGLDTPSLAASIDIENNTTTIFGNELSMDDIIWTGPLPSIREMALETGVLNTSPAGELEHQIRQAKKSGRRIHFLPPYRPENLLKLSEWLEFPVAAVKSNCSPELIRAVVGQRAIKEPVEVEAIDEAVSISADMQLSAMQFAAAGMKEYEVVSKVQQVAHAAGGRLSYSAILSVEGQVLHNHYYGNTLEMGQMVLVDAGAEQKMHYAGDLTRSFPVGPQFSSQQSELYTIVLNALEKAIAFLEPGRPFIEVHTRAAEELLTGLKELGIVKGDPAEAVQMGVHTLFFQCGLGHMMGLDVHDMEDLGEEYVGYSESIIKRKDFGWKSLRLGRALEAGFVLTVEPGIYLIPTLIDRWAAEKKLADFINYGALDNYRHLGGIRIEDNFLVTSNGFRKLGKYLPRSIAEIESVRQSNIIG